jgi:hypothetical protein
MGMGETQGFSSGITPATQALACTEIGKPVFGGSGVAFFWLLFLAKQEK